MDFWLNLRVERSFAKTNSMLTLGDENRRDPALRSTAVGSELFKGSVDYPLNSVRVEEKKEQPASKLQDEKTPPTKFGGQSSDHSSDILR